MVLKPLLGTTLKSADIKARATGFIYDHLNPLPLTPSPPFFFLSFFFFFFFFFAQILQFLPKVASRGAGLSQTTLVKYLSDIGADVSQGIIPYIDSIAACQM